MAPAGVNGARGVTLLGFAAICLFLGVGYAGGVYLGPFAIWPPVSAGAVLLSQVGGLHFWGVVWLALGVFLLVGAFREDQSKPMAGFAGMCGLWGSSYVWAFAAQLVDTGRSGLWLGAALYLAMLVACLGLSRMLNAPPLHVENISRALEAAQERLDYNVRHDGDENYG